MEILRKHFIYITAFFCGLSVMAVELSASRLLATTFSASSVVWTVVIGVIMISLSIGNVWGGRISDRQQNADRLYVLIWAAGLWIAGIALFGKYAIAGTVLAILFVLPASMASNLIITGTVISCVVIFVFPLLVMGMCSPYLVKLSVTDTTNNGKITGEVYALSTIGSIIGTFIPTFVTIPTIGTSKTFLLCALILNVISVVYFIVLRKKMIIKSICALLILILLAAPVNNSYAFWENNILYEGESIYNYLKVTKSHDNIILSTNVAFGEQSVYPLGQILTGSYYDFALMAPLFSKQSGFDSKLDTLVLGLGTGTYAKLCKRFFPQSQIDGVEIDKKIVDLSKKYFELQDNDVNKIYVTDARSFLKFETSKKYDVIMIDAYRDITIPFHMVTTEFFSLVRQHIKENGVIVINVNMRTGTNTEIPDAICATIKSNFEQIFRVICPNQTNELIFATNDKNYMQNFSKNAGNIPENSPLKGVSSYVISNIQATSTSGMIFTDEIAPVETMGHKILNEIVTQEVSEVKNYMEKHGAGVNDFFKMLTQ